MLKVFPFVCKGNDTVARLAHKLGVKSGEDRNGVHNLPFRPRDSEVSSGQDAARKEVLQSIASALINTDCVCLYGENGSGKSHLASQYAYESLRATDGFGRYRQILWVNASRPQRYEEPKTL